MDIKKIRKDFPMLAKTMHGKPLIYLDSAATTQKPLIVINSIEDFYKNHYGTVHRAVYELALSSTKEYQQARETVKNFINAKDSKEIIFTKGTTESINLVAYSFGKRFIEPGDEIILGTLEHHANIVPWQIMADDSGAKIKVIPLDKDKNLDLNAYKKLLSDKTKLVAIAHVSNVVGTINPIDTIIKLAHEKNAKVLIDGAQSISHLAVDVQALDADFFVFSGHKLYGPTGVGILYGKKELLEEMPPYQTGGDMIDKVSFEKTTFNTIPLKFEAGTPPIAEVLGLAKAIDYVSSIGLINIQNYEHELLEHMQNGLLAIDGLHILGPLKNKTGIVNFIVEGVHSLDIGSFLDYKGVAIRTGNHCSQVSMEALGIKTSCRASLGLYNSLEEIDLFISYLKETIETLR